jgi:hypothetical protein
MAMAAAKTSVKIYDPHRGVIHAQMVTNHPYKFKHRRQVRQKGLIILGRVSVSKRVANLYRYGEVTPKAR